jgi:signal transduction histidine kinase
LTRLFLRIYLALAFVLLVFFVLVFFLIRPPDDQTLPSRFQLMATAPALVQEQLAQTTDPEERQAVLDSLSDELGAPVRALPIAQVVNQLGPLEADRLERGDPVVSLLGSGPPAVLVRIPDQPLVAAVQPKGPPIRIAWALVLAVLVLGIAASVYTTIRPLHAQLDVLSQAAKQFGSGNLDSRAPVHSADDAGHLAETFNEMAARVQGLIQSRQELLMAVSHELRTPVSRLRFAIEMVADEDDAKMRAKKVDKIHGDLVELDELISELLTYTSLGEGREPNLATVDCSHELSKLAHDARALNPKIDLVFEENTLGEIQADKLLFKRAIGNLLSNAVRYTTSRVELVASLDDKGLVVVVDDDGPGIPEADRERVFEPLVRLDKARSRHTGGVGLGLALARRIARSHGGTLVVSTSPAGGARFTLELPSQGAI